MRVVLQTRNTFHLQLTPVMPSVWPPGTMCSTPFSFETWAMAWASAEFTLPTRKSMLSRSISLRAFCTAAPASPLVESSDNSSSWRPRMPFLALSSSTASSQPVSSLLPNAA
jgi:hypothetical protein